MKSANIAVFCKVFSLSKKPDSGNFCPKKVILQFHRSKKRENQTVASPTVRKMKKVKRWPVPPFKKRKKSNSGKLHRSKKGKNQTVASSTVRKTGKIKQWQAPPFEKERKSNSGKLHCSKKGKNQTVASSTVRKKEKIKHYFKIRQSFLLSNNVS